MAALRTHTRLTPRQRRAAKSPKLDYSIFTPERCELYAEQAEKAANLGARGLWQVADAWEAEARGLRPGIGHRMSECTWQDVREGDEGYE